MLEMVSDREPVLYSRLFLVEKAYRGWRLVIDPSPLSSYVMQTKFCMEIIVFVLGLCQERGCNVLSHCQGCIFPNSNTDRIKTIAMICIEGHGLLIQGLFLQSFNSSTGVHTGFSTGPSVGDLVTLVLGQLASSH